MIKRFLVVVGALVAVSLFAGESHAQGFGRGTNHSVGRPTTSPYLNLLAADAFGNVGIAGGYQTLVKPQIDSRKAINRNSAAISQLQSSGFGATWGGGGNGAGASFRNYSHYYPGMTGR